MKNYFISAILMLSRQSGAGGGGTLNASLNSRGCFLLTSSSFSFACSFIFSCSFSFSYYLFDFNSFSSFFLHLGLHNLDREIYNMMLWNKFATTNNVISNKITTTKRLGYSSQIGFDGIFNPSSFFSSAYRYPIQDLLGH